VDSSDEDMSSTTICFRLVVKLFVEAVESFSVKDGLGKFTVFLVRGRLGESWFGEDVFASALSSWAARAREVLMRAGGLLMSCWGDCRDAVSDEELDWEWLLAFVEIRTISVSWI
jgi:hypothetical protein